MEVKLALLKGLTDDSSVTISSTPYSIGRCKTAKLIIPHVSVSRNHCQIAREENLWKIYDSSSSGTYINDVLVGKENSEILNEGDTIRLGPLDSNISWTFYPLRNDEDKNFNSNSQIQVLITLPSKDEHFSNIIKCLKGNIKKEKPSTSISEKIENKLSSDSKVKQLKDDGTATETSEQMVSAESSNLKKESLLTNLKNTSTGSKSEKTSSEYEPEIVRRLLENKLIKQEEEKQFLLQKLEKMEEAQEVLFQKLNDKHDKFCKSSEKEKNNKTDSEIEKKDETEENYKKLIEKNNFNYKNWSENNGKSDENENLKLQSKLLDCFTDLMETELQCTICSELFVTSVTLSCTHTFCKFCINQWKKKQKTCPICRKKITNETRSLVVDNYIDKMVENLSVDLKKRREALIAERKEVIPPKKLRSHKFR